MKTRVVGTRHHYDVWIGRASSKAGGLPGADGLFGNRHPVGWPCPHCNDRGDRFVHTQEQAIAIFHGEFLQRVQNDVEFRKKVVGLRGKFLGCPGNCKPRGLPCHGDVIAQWVDMNAEYADLFGTDPTVPDDV